MNHTRTLLYQNGYVYPSIGRHISVELVSPKKVVPEVPKKVVATELPKQVVDEVPKQVVTTELPKQVVDEVPKQVVAEDGVLFKDVEFRKPFYFIIADQFLVNGNYFINTIGKTIHIDNKNIYKLCHVEVSFEGQMTNDTTDMIIYAVHLGKRHTLANVSVTPSFDKSVQLAIEFKEEGVVSFCAVLLSDIEGYLNISIHGSMSTTVE